VTDADVAAYYNANQAGFTTPEAACCARAGGAEKGASAAEVAAAKAKAEAIVAELRKAPADFAKVAKTKSDDAVSAEQGGDLDIVTRVRSQHQWKRPS
jgi:peptidyl-prolyl cis-trans isomerase D